MIVYDDSKLISNASYIPEMDGQELIDKLWEICSQNLRWDSIKSFWRYTPDELAIEGHICYMAWSENDDFLTRMYIYLFGFDLIPYVKYRRDHPPQGNWHKGWYNFPEKVERRYREVCSRLLDASEKELLRD